MIEAVSFPETLVSIYQTGWCNNPEDLHTHCCGNLKFHLNYVIHITDIINDDTQFVKFQLKVVCLIKLL
jgi:hypothetical protein